MVSRRAGEDRFGRFRPSLDPQAARAGLERKLARRAKLSPSEI